LAFDVIIAHCTVGGRAGEACEVLLDSAEAAGVDHFLLAERLVVFEGGLVSWAHAGMDFVDPTTGRSTRKVHAWCREIANMFPVGMGYELLLSEGLDSSSRPFLQCESERRLATLMGRAARGRLQWFPSVLPVTAPEAVESAAGGARVIFVDVRTAKEREVSTIPGALRPEDFVMQANQHVEDTNVSLIVVFGTAGVKRAGGWCIHMMNTAAFRGLDSELLRKKLRNLEGGLAAWLHAGMGLVDGTGAVTRRVHALSPDSALSFPLGMDLELLVEHGQTSTAVPFIDSQAAAILAPVNAERYVRSLLRDIPKESLIDILQASAARGYED